MLKSASTVPLLLSVTLAGVTKKLSWPAMPWDTASLSIVCPNILYCAIQVSIIAGYFIGGVALSGLTATTAIGIEDVKCPSNSTSISECSSTAPPQSSRCLGNFTAAGIRCSQG